MPSGARTNCEKAPGYGNSDHARNPGNRREACRYEPDLNRAYQEMAAHYGVAVLPARPRKHQPACRRPELVDS
jgi:hypothetical protein